MQFTYEREGNDCWLTDTLSFIRNDVIHYEITTGYWAGHKKDFTEVKDLLSYLKEERLTLDNFPKLEDYLKENYPEVLPKQQLTERELLENLVERIESWADAWEMPYKLWDAYKAAKLYLDPNYDESEDFFV